MQHQGEQAVWEQTEESEVNTSCEKSFPRRGYLRESILLKLRRWKGRVHQRQVMLCIQGNVICAVVTDLAADAPAVPEILLVVFEMRDMCGKDVCEAPLSEAYGSDVLQAEVERAQKPDLPKRVQVFFGIVSVAVGIPCRAQKTFCFIEADICP